MSEAAISDEPVVEHLRTQAQQAGHDIEISQEFSTLTVTVPASWWVCAARHAHEQGYHFYDWLSAVDEGDQGMDVLLCVWAGHRQLLLRTRVSGQPLALPTLTGIYAGANWGERETAEMFGIDFPGHPNLETLLLPEEFVGHPLRKDFVLASRATRAWPGEKEPEERHDKPAAAPAGPQGDQEPSAARQRPTRRAKVAALGVPDPSWGPRDAHAQQAPAQDVQEQP